MKKLIVITVLFCGGCMATQQEVMDLTDAVSQIVPTVREEVAKANVSIEGVLTKVEEVNEAVATAEDPVEAISKGWDASKSFNPYYGYGLLGIGLLKLLRDNKILGGKYSAAKTGMEKFRNENPDKAKELYNDVGEARRARKVA